MLISQKSGEVKPFMALCQIVWKQLRDGTNPGSIFQSVRCYCVLPRDFERRGNDGHIGPEAIK